MLHIYVDGSSRKGGKGGFGVVIFDDCRNLIDAYCEQFDSVTNNQMELKAILKSFELIDTKYKNKEVTIYSDSAYCINILSSWMFNWSNNNWMTTKGELIKNYEIILSLYKYYTKNFYENQIHFTKVEGHTGIIGN